jgi:protein-S-isoprenylcysteine O-methyltransferase Ste14
MGDLTMLDIMVFFVGALVIAALSRRSLADPRSHGFMRFLAFEAIWALIVMNAGSWFRDPLSLRQIVSWAILIASAALAVEAFRKLASSGNPRPVTPESPLYTFENTSQLVSAGIYGKIRHPMYASLILFAWGAALKSTSFWSIATALAATGFLFFTARTEELENLERFGEPYDSYMEETWMFIPGLF